jgi:hypothetical protein
MVLLENFRTEPLTDKFERFNHSTFICFHCHEWLHTYDATHSKVRKENHPERAKEGVREIGPKSIFPNYPVQSFGSVSSAIIP